MVHRLQITLTALACAAFGASMAGAQELALAAKTAPTPTTTSVPRTPDGHPDLGGYWTNATVIPLERPKDLGNKAFFTPEEAAAYEKAKLADNGPTGKGTYADVHYNMAQFGLEKGQSKVADNIRTSLITDPANGRIPPMTPEGRERNAERAAKNKGHEFDSAENRSLSERCILWPNEGPPMMPVGYNSNLEIVQGAGYVAVMQEMIHDARVIPTDGGSHVPANIREWMGDSRGHWEGDTLVVDTTNFRPETAFHGASENLHVVERFRRVDADTILYSFTVEDPHTWASPWSAEYPMTKVKGPIFEYACHEGNYGMENNLSGARAEEKKLAEKKALEAK
ncbi:MAG TPA: hypothetical protein VMH80_20590 [Bryobacteraceae bacterium]|nr:hypothetical protein [Bryobacteraceae bacterium]